MNTDGYRRVSIEKGPVQIKVRGSRFLGYVFPVNSSGDISRHLEDLRKKYHDSTHVCFAYRWIRNGRGEERAQDDGEPRHTAGIPILKEIQACDFWNTLVAVIRYFGGTKLGTGGLARAYSETARRVLDGIPAHRVHPTVRGVLLVPFEQMDIAMRIIDSAYIRKENQSFRSDGMLLDLSVHQKYVQEFRKKLDSLGIRILENFR